MNVSFRYIQKRYFNLKIFPYLSCLLRHVSENYSAIIKKFLSHSKQIMTKRGYNFYTVNTTKEIRLRNQEEVEKGEDTIHVYKDGYKIEYNGVRGKER